MVTSDRDFAGFACSSCHEKLTVPFTDGWARCLACGSDTNFAAWGRSVHGIHSLADYRPRVGDLTSSLDWMTVHRNHSLPNTFLDVGCAQGAALAGMQDRGWAVHGFDRFLEAKIANPPGEQVTIGETFRANLFVQRFAAIMVHGTLEITPAWVDCLAECHAACLTGGIVHVHGKRPTQEAVHIPDDLHVISPLMIRFWTERFGFDVIDAVYTAEHQSWMLRRAT